MRIIGGTLRGRRLAPVRGPIRPTSDRLREALFNAIGTAVCDGRWLDLFAGTGAVGIEAWSRGARPVTWVDRDEDAVRLIRKNLQICGIEESVRVQLRDAIVTLAHPGDGAPFDFIFLDPPYDFRRYDKLLRKLADSPALAPGGLAMLEMFRKNSLEEIPDGLRMERQLEAGDSRIVFLRRT